jgi:hypothetical protein
LINCHQAFDTLEQASSTLGSSSTAINILSKMSGKDSGWLITRLGNIDIAEALKSDSNKLKVYNSCQKHFD